MNPSYCDLAARLGRIIEQMQMAESQNDETGYLDLKVVRDRLVSRMIGIVSQDLKGQ
jgi:hypothetical protein